MSTKAKINRRIGTPFVIFCVLLFCGNATYADEKVEAQRLAQDNFDKLLEKTAQEHEGKWYGWMKEDFPNVLMELEIIQKGSNASVSEVSKDLIENKEIEHAYIVELSRNCKARAKATRKGGLERSPASLMGIMPWTNPKEIAHLGKVLVAKRKGKTELEILQIEFGLEKPTMLELCSALNLDQAKLLPNDQQELLVKFRERFAKVFPNANNHYFFCLHAARSKSPISGSFDVPPMASTLVEIAGQHQLWLEELKIEEQHRLNGIKRAFRCHVGIRGVKRYAKFTQHGRPLNLPGNWEKWDAVSWSDWTGRLSFVSQWLYVESPKGGEWMLTDLGVQSKSDHTTRASTLDPESGFQVGFATKKLCGLECSSPGNLIDCFCGDAEFADPTAFFVQGIATKTMLTELLKETKHEMVDIGEEVVEVQ